MKKLVLSVAIVLLVANAGLASEGGSKASKVTFFSLRSFKDNFGFVPNVNWEATPNFDKASFTRNGKPVNAYFSKDGDFIGITSKIDLSNLPAKAREKIEKKYGPDSIKEMLEFQANEDYYLPSYTDLMDSGFEGNDNYFVLVEDNNHTSVILKITPRGSVSVFKKLQGL